MQSVVAACLRALSCFDSSRRQLKEGMTHITRQMEQICNYLQDHISEQNVRFFQNSMLLSHATSSSKWSGIDNLFFIHFALKLFASFCIVPYSWGQQTNTAWLTTLSPPSLPPFFPRLWRSAACSRSQRTGLPSHCSDERPGSLLESTASPDLSRYSTDVVQTSTREDATAPEQL